MIRSNQAPDLHPAAVGFSAIRGLPGGRMRQYCEVQFTNGWPGANRYHRMFAGTGSIIASSTAPSYAVLDVIDADGEIVQDFDIPTAEAFRYVKRMLGLTVVAQDGEAATAVQPRLA